MYSGRNFEDRLGRKVEEFSRVLYSVSSELVEAILRLEAAERPQWPRVYSFGRPRSRGRMPSLVGDSGQVLGSAGLGFN